MALKRTPLPPHSTASDWVMAFSPAFDIADGTVNGQTIAIDGAAYQATGGNFSALRAWDDERWDQVKQLIRSTNEKDRAQRTV